MATAFRTATKLQKYKKLCAAVRRCVASSEGEGMETA